MASTSAHPILRGLMLLGCLCTMLSCGMAASKVREPAWAGKFYTADATRLRERVDNFLAEGAKKTTVDGKPIAIIAPHAGYDYSGRCAGVAFATVKGKTYRRVVVMAVNHRGPRFRGGSILDVDAYKTPLGTIPLDRDACASLLKSTYFKTVRGAHRAEHSLEVELPFLQRALGTFKLVPIVMSGAGSDDFAPMAAAVRKVVDDDTLVVVSCDFTHYGRNFGYAPFRSNVRKNIEKLDKGAVDFILKRDPKGFWGYIQRTRATICGRCPVAVLLAMLPGDAKGQLVNYYTSGDATGDYRHSVSYAGIVFTAQGAWCKAPEPASAVAPEPNPPAAAGAEPTDKRKGASSSVGVTETGKKKLLAIARKTLVAVTSGKKVPNLKLDDADLQGRYGVFVTLHKLGKLRGCIGNFRPQTPLFRTVAVQARLSALKDHRFKPVRQEEVADIDIEISVLLPEERIKSPTDWEFGKHGIIVRRGYRQATFLPQVAEHFQTREEMLSACCRKARMPSYMWRASDTMVYRYRAQVFGEKAEAK